MKRRIVCVTDCIDIAANELRATLLRESFHDDEIVVEPFAPVRPNFSTINANFVVRLLAESYPEGTIFVAVCNGDKIRATSVVGRTKHKGMCFVGRNNGSWDWLTRDFGLAELVNIDEQYGRDSRTDPNGFVSFAGKYTTAPIAARVAKGTPLLEFGQPTTAAEITRFDLADGTIVHVDNFGLMKFTGPLERPEEGAHYRVELNGRTIAATYSRRMMSNETGDWVLFPGSSLGMYELGMVRGHGADAVGASVGHIVKIRRL